MNVLRRFIAIVAGILTCALVTFAAVAWFAAREGASFFTTESQIVVFGVLGIMLAVSVAGWIALRAHVAPEAPPEPPRPPVGKARLYVPSQAAPLNLDGPTHAIGTTIGPVTSEQPAFHFPPPTHRRTDRRRSS